MDHSQELPFEWDNDADGFPADKFDRAKYAEFLTNYLIGKSKEENYVLNLNATWGAGKTWFLKKWFNTIKNRHPSIYIDCWKNDHSKDPFLAVMSSITNGLDEMVEKRYKKGTLSSKGILLIKSVAPEIAKGLIKKYLGLDKNEITKILDDDDDASISEVGGTLVTELIKLHEKTNDSLEEFKNVVSNYLDVIELESSRTLPLFVFLDELDRCRPTYAIETLETVKHIFDMSRVVFVIATDKSQLQHSIKAVYGTDFNSSKYLDRFFNRTVTLQQKSNREYIEYKLETSDRLIEFMHSDQSNSWLYGTVLEKKEMCLNIFEQTSYIFDMDLRTISQWMDRMDAILSNKSHGINILYLSVLLGANCVDYLIYRYFVERKHLSPTSASIGEMLNKYSGGKITTASIKLTFDTQQLGECFYGKTGVGILNPWEKPTTQAFELLQLFAVFDTAFGTNKNGLENTHLKIYNNLYRRNSSVGASFDIDALSYLFEIYHKDNPMKRDDYIQLVELATILE